MSNPHGSPELFRQLCAQHARITANIEAADEQAGWPYRQAARASLDQSRLQDHAREVPG